MRDTHGNDEKNPLSFTAVKERIEAALFAYVGRVLVMPVPNITNFYYGRDVGYVVEQIALADEVEKISGKEQRQRIGAVVTVRESCFRSLARRASQKKLARAHRRRKAPMDEGYARHICKWTKTPHEALIGHRAMNLPAEEGPLKVSCRAPKKFARGRTQVSYPGGTGGAVGRREALLQVRNSPHGPPKGSLLAKKGCRCRLHRSASTSCAMASPRPTSTRPSTRVCPIIEWSYHRKGIAKQPPQESTWRGPCRARRESGFCAAPMFARARRAWPSSRL